MTQLYSHWFRQPVMLRSLLRCFILYLNSCVYVFKLCMNIPKHYDSAISVLDKLLLWYFYKHFKFLVCIKVKLNDKYAFFLYGIKWMVGWTVAYYHKKRQALKRVDVNRAVFDEVKGVVLHDHWGILTKVCCRHFMKILKNHTNLWKMGIWCHL